MKKILTVYLLLLGFSAQSQILEVETSDLILKSVHSCADDFMEDTLILKKNSFEKYSNKANIHKQ